MFTHYQQPSPAGSAALGNTDGVVTPPCFKATSSAGRVALSELALGDKASITSICAQGELGRRLRDMGLMPGVSVTLAARAPLGDPLVVTLDGYTLSVRCAEAACVIVAVNQ